MHGCVFNDASLTTEFARAQEGDVIDMRGATITRPTLAARSFAKPVTIRNATIVGIEVDDLVGVNFADITFVAPSDYRPVSFVDCDRLRFAASRFKGPASGPVDEIIPTLLYLRRCADATVTDSEFSRGQFGINHLNCDNLVAAGNRFHDMRQDAIQGSGVVGLVFDGNDVTDFYPAGEIGTSGDHPDVVQITSVAGARRSSNIAVTNNRIRKGVGRKKQGIYINDEGDLYGPPEGVTITGNIVESGMTNGILVASGTGVVVNDNIVYSSGGQSFLRVSPGVELVELLRNAASLYLPPDYTPDPSNVPPPS